MSSQNGTNMVNDNADDPLVQTFYGVGPSFVLIGFATFKMVFAIISQLFCASLLYVTAKTSSLRETYNWLIAANSLASLLFSFTFFIQFWIAVLGINLVPLRICFPLMAVPIFFAQCQYLLFLALAIDRLIIAFFPIWHLKNIQNSSSASIAYLATIFGAISIYSAYCVFTGINYSFVEKPENFRLLTCSTPDAVPSFVFQIPLYFNLFSLSQYLFLCYIMAIKKSSAANFKATRKMLKAIVVAFLVEFSGWFGNTLARNICIWLELTQMQQWYTMNFAGLILVPVLAFYVPMLFILSSDYSRAFHRCFGLKFPFSSLASSPSIADGIIVSVPINAKKVRSADEAWRNY